MAARHNARLKRFRYRLKVHFHSLAAGLFKFLENMIIAAGNQNSRFPDSKVANKLEVFLAGSDPCGNFGEFKPQRLAFLDCLPVLFAVNEKLGLADNPVRSAQFRHKLVKINDLVNRVRLNRLLTVA